MTLQAGNLTIEVTAEPGSVIYTVSSQDWRLMIDDGRFEIEPIATGRLEYSSGINLDNLAALIVAAKADAVARGISWDGN